MKAHRRIGVARCHTAIKSCWVRYGNPSHGTVTLFRAYPDGVDTFRAKEAEFADPGSIDVLRSNNEYNRRIYEHLAAEAMAGRGALIGWTKEYRRTEYPDDHEQQPIPALKSYIMSPFVTEESVRTLVEKVLEARKRVSYES